MFYSSLPFSWYPFVMADPVTLNDLLLKESWLQIRDFLSELERPQLLRSRPAEQKSSYEQWGKTNRTRKKEKACVVGRDGGTWEGKKKWARNWLRGFKRKLKIHRERERERGEAVSESGGQAVPATSLVAMTSQLISLLVRYYSSTTPLLAELLPARLFNGRVWGAAFTLSITQSE